MADGLGAAAIGRTIGSDFIASLPAGTDPNGENGEYHTFCYDGPIFRTPVRFRLGSPFSRSYDIRLDDGTEKTTPTGSPICKSHKPSMSPTLPMVCLMVVPGIGTAQNPADRNPHEPPPLTTKKRPTPMITRIIPYRKISLCSLLLALLAPVLLTAGCNDTQENEGAPDPTTPLPEPKPEPKTYPLVITDIRNLPPKTTFDRIAVQITGVDWSIIATVEAPYENGAATLALPLEFPAEQLQVADRRGGNMAGYWPGTASDPAALVATLGDFIAYRGDESRTYLSLRLVGEGSSASKASSIISMPTVLFEVTGATTSYHYNDCSFVAGWNAFANINVFGRLARQHPLHDGRTRPARTDLEFRILGALANMKKSSHKAALFIIIASRRYRCVQSPFTL